MYEHYQEILAELRGRRKLCSPTDNDAARELSLAITNLEESWTHSNAATYYRAGAYLRTNADEAHPGVWGNTDS